MLDVEEFLGWMLYDDQPELAAFDHPVRRFGVVAV